MLSRSQHRQGYIRCLCSLWVCISTRTKLRLKICCAVSSIGLGDLETRFYLTVLRFLCLPFQDEIRFKLSFLRASFSDSSALTADRAAIPFRDMVAALVCAFLNKRTTELLYVKTLQTPDAVFILFMQCMVVKSLQVRQIWLSKHFSLLHFEQMNLVFSSMCSS